MHLFYIIAIAVALALGIYSVVVQRGANLVKLDRRMTAMSVIWGALELLAACAGYGIGHWLLQRDIAENINLYWVHVLAGFILVVIGIRMLFGAFKKKSLIEHRMENVDMRTDVVLSLKLCVDGLFAGIATGLMQFSIVYVIVAVFVLACVFAVFGYVSGRAWGAEYSQKADAAGGVLMCVLGLMIQFLY